MNGSIAGEAESVLNPLPHFSSKGGKSVVAFLLAAENDDACRSALLCLPIKTRAPQLGKNTLITLYLFERKYVVLKIVTCKDSRLWSQPKRVTCEKLYSFIKKNETWQNGSLTPCYEWHPWLKNPVIVVWALTVWTPYKLDKVGIVLQGLIFSKRKKEENQEMTKDVPNCFPFFKSRFKTKSSFPKFGVKYVLA